MYLFHPTSSDAGTRRQLATGVSGCIAPCGAIWWFCARWCGTVIAWRWAEARAVPCVPLGRRVEQPLVHGKQFVDLYVRVVCAFQRKGFWQVDDIFADESLEHPIRRMDSRSSGSSRDEAGEGDVDVGGLTEGATPLSADAREDEYGGTGTGTGAASGAVSGAGAAAGTTAGAAGGDAEGGSVSEGGDSASVTDLGVSPSQGSAHGTQGLRRRHAKAASGPGGASVARGPSSDPLLSSGVLYGSSPSWLGVVRRMGHNPSLNIRRARSAASAGTATAASLREDGSRRGMEEWDAAPTGGSRWPTKESLKESALYFFGVCMVHKQYTVCCVGGCGSELSCSMVQTHTRPIPIPVLSGTCCLTTLVCLLSCPSPLPTPHPLFLPHSCAHAHSGCQLLPPDKVSQRFLAQRGDVHTFARALLPPVLLRWWLRVVDPGELGVDSPGRDLYIETFCVQLLGLLCIIFGYTTMVQFEGDTLASQLQNNQFSGSMVGGVSLVGRGWHFACA